MYSNILINNFLYSQLIFNSLLWKEIYVIVLLMTLLIIKQLMDILHKLYWSIEESSLILIKHITQLGMVVHCVILVP